MSDLGSSNWSETAASNTASPPDGWPEGMNPSDVNNSAREGMAAEKRFWNRINAIKTTGGTTTAYTVTYDVAAAAYYDGELSTIVVDQTCGNTPTLNVNSLGARSLRKWVGGWATLASGDLTAGQVIVARYNLTDTTFDIISGQGGRLTGEVVSYAGTTAPDGWLFSFGQAVSRTTYAALFAVIGTTYGAGDGSTTFNLPDLRGRVVAGKDDMGGTSANRLTSPLNGDTLGGAGGTESHSHGVSITSAAAGGGSAPTSFGTDYTGVSFEHQHAVIGNTASGSSIQPTFILNKIIKT